MPGSVSGTAAPPRAVVEAALQFIHSNWLLIAQKKVGKGSEIAVLEMVHFIQSFYVTVI